MFVDGFDHYSGFGFGVRKAWIGQSGSVTGRGGGRAIRGGSHLIESGGLLAFAAGYANWCEAFGNQLMAFFSASGQRILSLSNVGDGRLLVEAYGNFRQSGILDFLLHLKQWYFTELQGAITITGFTPPSTWHWDIAYVARVNEKLLASGYFTGISTPFAPEVSYLTFVPPGGGSSCFRDDFWVTDGELLGDVRIRPLYPNQDGDYQDFTPNGGVNHYDRIQETNPDDDTTYLESATSGHREVEHFQGTDATVLKGLAYWACVRLDVGPSGFIPLLRSGGSDYEGSSVGAPENYEYRGVCLRQSPFTSADWDGAEVTALQGGIKNGS